MSTTLESRSEAPEGQEKRGNRELYRTRGRWGLLIGLPVIVALIGGGWLIWRATADLDDIEQRALSWDQVASLTWEHVVISSNLARIEQGSIDKHRLIGFAMLQLSLLRVRGLALGDAQ